MGWLLKGGLLLNLRKVVEGMGDFSVIVDDLVLYFSSFCSFVGRLGGCTGRYNLTAQGRCFGDPPLQQRRSNVEFACALPVVTAKP